MSHDHLRELVVAYEAADSRRVAAHVAVHRAYEALLQALDSYVPHQSDYEEPTDSELLDLLISLSEYEADDSEVELSDDEKACFYFCKMHRYLVGLGPGSIPKLVTCLAEKRGSESAIIEALLTFYLKADAAGERARFMATAESSKMASILRNAIDECHWCTRENGRKVGRPCAACEQGHQLLGLIGQTSEGGNG